MQQMKLDELLHKQRELESKIAALNSSQLAVKLLANSGYGAITQSSFRYYVLAIGEAITLTGQACDKHLEKTLNVYMNKLLKTENIDYIIYGDTDSIILSVDSLVRKLCKTPDDPAIVTPLLDKICKQMQNTVVRDSIDHIFNICNCKEKLMDYKREAIASKCIFCKKKKYLMKIHNSEGVDYNPPKLKIMGIEVVRSSTPKFVRNELKSAIPIILDHDVARLRTFVEDVRSRFNTLPVESIAFPRGVSDVDKWVDGAGYKNRVPIHVRGAINYNNLVAGSSKHDKIRNGDKVKFVYLKMPNPIKENIIAFPTSGTIPAEFGLNQYIDKDLQFEKAFISPLDGILDAIGWHLVENATLEEFFG